MSYHFSVAEIIRNLNEYGNTGYFPTFDIMVYDNYFLSYDINDEENLSKMKTYFQPLEDVRMEINA